ncbi:D-alanyl-lipoteichoic acid biosynthesis protein DltB [Listeria fleischmannii]|uniref:Teichoic acid D-alanyltransferase n=1 Tax=Listeria fleischmannii TaxID=1069827 RepID=A0A841YEZ5_9LIST|nr:D-alanyl-lipoteichoic acid biosynthesis protein DltB [Listeria fleischmannii]MBC1398846.1 D-alanyl-lipoteichoic acid biosynthesis protein DltB [Listeria fleischmannii]MBC1418975.1 D-alanyl-lipoteichoic acid biosynthesis protein DltB [Listeria fleischmannii]MBC1427099.1 D-alanyl-lipoteichoic acid biosynthesis protein DltB [Listeria fleischmannii]STY34107.1 D-alanyl-lipoteichoic acid biosynthesis protein DltB [Listeria fleischmannii subsp. coloradonensis]
MTTPYGSIFYFAILALFIAPIVIANLMGKRLPVYNAFVTLLFIFFMFSSNLVQGIAFIVFIFWQLIVVRLYFNYRRVQNKNHGGIFTLFVIMSILPLMIVKVQPLLAENTTLVGFLGISYLTFKATTMVMEIRDGLIKEYNSVEFVNFLLFFPTISSGPIDRFRRFQKDVKNPLDPAKYVELLNRGIFYIFLGFLYKFIIAYLIDIHWKTPLEGLLIQHIDFNTSLIGYMYAYSMYLFFDFAGYSLFAVGVSYLLGIKTPMNFNKPFLARNIKDFWNRWHMTLSFWFRDFIFMRLVFFLTKKKWFKNKFTIAYIAYFVNFFIMGIWHGLHWYYIVYGLYQATIIVLFDIFERINKKYKFYPKNKITYVIGMIITFNFVCFGFLIFSGIFDKITF